MYEGGNFILQLKISIKLDLAPDYFEGSPEYLLQRI